MRQELGDLPPESRKDLLVQLWLDPQFVKAKAAEDTPQGKWVDLQMQRSTNKGMFFLSALTLLPACFFHRLKITSLPGSVLGWVLLTSIGYLIGFRFILSWIALRLGARFSVRRFFSTERLSQDEVERALESHLLATSRTWANRLVGFWGKQSFVSPFYYRFIWWWMLIFGLATVQIEYEQLMSTMPQKLPQSLLLSDLAISLFKVCMVSVIAFIATNVLREVLFLKERYSDNVTKAQTLTEQLDGMAPQLEELKKSVGPLVTQLYSVLANCVSTLNLSTRLTTFTRELANLDPQAAKQSQLFLTNVAQQIENFVDQIEKGRKGSQNLWLLATLNRYINTQREILNTKDRRVITRFSDLAHLARDIVEVTFPDEQDIEGVEFYALLVIPPHRFLNYGQSSDLETDLAGNKQWEYYLEGNIKATERKIRQHRYFLSVRGIQGNSAELSDVESERVKSILRKWVKTDASGRPVKETHGDFERYKIEDHPEGTADWSRLGKVISEIYHSPGCCKVREFELSKFNQHFLHPQRKRPLDYFALRHKGSWVFCLETVYDKLLDVADIGIYYEDPQDTDYFNQWETVKNKLDVIFFPDNSSRKAVFDLEEYADDTERVMINEPEKSNSGASSETTKRIISHN